MATRSKRRKLIEGNDESRIESSAAYENEILSKDLPNGIGKLYLDARTADVRFKFDPDESSDSSKGHVVPAHKCILAATSNVFDTMFYGTLKEQSDITIVDATKEAFVVFLQFFYHQELKITMKNVSELIRLADKYNVVNCVDCCIDFMVKNMTNDDMVTGLQLAILHSNKTLEVFCESHISWNTKEVLQTEEFLNCNEETVQHILKMNALSCSESELFEACMSWIKARSRTGAVTKSMIRKYFGNLFYEFRFTSMNMKDFNALYLSYDTIFSKPEFKDIIQTFTPNPNSPTLFNANPRQYKWDSGGAIRCDREDKTTNKQIKLATNSTIVFTSNTPILLGELVFALFGRLRDGSYRSLKEEQKVIVKIIVNPSGKSCDCDQCTKTLSTFTVNLQPKIKNQTLLPEPILIRPGFRYRISLILPVERVRNLCYSSRKAKTEVAVQPNIIINFYNDEKILVNNVLSPISTLKFNKM